MNMFRLWRLFHRSGTRGTSSRTSALAIVAFASATAVFLTVLGGRMASSGGPPPTTRSVA